MFLYFYQICVALFILQGISMPFLVILSGARWRRQSRRLERLRGEVARGKVVKAGEPPESILNALPKLKPLNCENCGGSISLKEAGTLCPYCGTLGALPEDYAAAVALRPEVRGLLKSALRHWRAARLLTFPLSHWLFLLLIFAEPLVLFPVVLIGSNLYRDTLADRVFEGLGETASFVVMLSAFLGFVVWMIVFIFLAALSKSLRRRLPAVPVSEESVRATEAAGCQSCGGRIEYDAGDFACICDYCNVENLRVRFTRRERGRAEKQKARTNSLLFGAMEILDEFVGTFFFVLLFLVAASTLLVIFYAIKRLL